MGKRQVIQVAWLKEKNSCSYLVGVSVTEFKSDAVLCGIDWQHDVQVNSSFETLTE